MTVKLLLVEDNAALRDMLAAHLSERGFDLDKAPDGASALSLAARRTHDAIILDLGLPDMDGIDVLQVLRGPPTLILTARDGVEDRVRGLDAGADDYLVKPFAPAELEARLRALLRRPGLKSEPSYTWRDLRFEPATRTLRHGETCLDLTAREAAVLEALLRAGDSIVVRDLLQDRIYRLDGDVTPNALEAVVSRLRRKLTQLGHYRVETVRGIGYRLGA